MEYYNNENLWNALKVRFCTPPPKNEDLSHPHKKKKKIRFQRNRVYYFTCLFSLFWYIYVNDFPFLPFSPFWYFLPTYPFPWISSYLWSTYNIFIFVSNETFFQQSFVVVVLWGWSGFREEERRDCCHFLKSSFFFYVAQISFVSETVSGMFLWLSRPSILSGNIQISRKTLKGDWIPVWF